MGGPGEFAVLRCAACGLASTYPRIDTGQLADYYPAGYHESTGGRRARFDERQAGFDERQAGSDERQAGSDERQAGFDERQAGSDERQAGSGERQAGSHEGEAAGGGVPVPPTGLVERLRLAAIIRLGPYRPLSRRRPGRMLDVGCGNGELARAFARRGWRVAGVEPVAAAAARAAAGGVEVHTGTLVDAPWREPSFDAVVFNHSLEHLPDPLDGLRRAAALLREGGVVAVAVPNFACWQRRLFGSRWFGLDLPRHLQHLDASALAALMTRAGLQPVEQVFASMRPGVLVSLQYAAFGRARWTGRGLRLAAWAIAPLLWFLDRFAAGDCLHVFAVAAEPQR
jgi:2-polyprenyl-3-methyl-5-hydroxy-6-metoxy-1,4-benzoquinol methylase